MVGVQKSNGLKISSVVNSIYQVSVNKFDFHPSDRTKVALLYAVVPFQIWFVFMAKKATICPKTARFSA